MVFVLLLSLFGSFHSVHLHWSLLAFVKLIAVMMIVYGQQQWFCLIAGFIGGSFASFRRRWRLSSLVGSFQVVVVLLLDYSLN